MKTKPTPSEFDQNIIFLTASARFSSYANPMNSTNSPEVLIEVTRGTNSDEHIENIHYGSVAVVDASGKLLHYAGDPSWQTFSRSTIKPFQATPFITDGGMAEFKLSLEEVALLCASHNAENFHLEGVESILKKSGANASQLKCGCHAPLMFSALNQTPPANAQWSALHNNCSGKHAGFLAWCNLNDKLTEAYLEFQHPLQHAIRRSLSIWCNEKTENFLVGTDGCSAPNYALPLKSLATGYARLSSIKGGGTAKTLFDAMTMHPEYVSGTGRHDLAFMQAGTKNGNADWVAKIGADGLQLVGIRSAGLGIAVKIADGNQRAVIAATVEVLRQLGLLKDIERSPLADWASPKIINVMGTETGRVRPAFQLKAAARTA
jgi:L-asparaginase II